MKTKVDVDVNQEELVERRETAIKAINNELKDIETEVTIKGFKYKLVKQNAIDIVVSKHCEINEVNKKDVKKIGGFEMDDDEKK